MPLVRRRRTICTSALTVPGYAASARTANNAYCLVYSKMHELATHEKEEDDLHFSPDSAWICSISKDR